MIRRRSAGGIAALCALALCAVAAGSSSAAQRAWVCVPLGPGHVFADAHCTGSTGGDYELVNTIPNGVRTSTTGTSQKTSNETKTGTIWKLKGALSGVVTEVQCEEVNGEGSVTNSESSVSGTGELNYTGCRVTKPEGKGCVVGGGAINTTELKATDDGVAENKLKFEPAAGSEFAIIPIEKCSIASLNNEFPTGGSFVANVSGATMTTTHAEITAQNTLKFGGVKAGLEGALTISDSEGGVVLN